MSTSSLEAGGPGAPPPSKDRTADVVITIIELLLLFAGGLLLSFAGLFLVFASDSCGYVGNKHTGTLLTLMSSDVYSIGGYHHQFRDVGYSVNFADFITVPAVAYYASCGSGTVAAPTYCAYGGTRYSYGIDFINGMNTIDLGNVNQPGTTRNQWIWDEAYAPTLLVPLQMRELDPAW